MAKRKVRVFEPLQESLRDALDYEKGEAVNLRVADIPPSPPRMAPREISKIRA